MSMRLTLAFYFLATFLQAGAYGLTFLLPLLFQEFGAHEKDVGNLWFHQRGSRQSASFAKIAAGNFKTFDSVEELMTELNADD